MDIENKWYSVTFLKGKSSEEKWLLPVARVKGKKKPVVQA